MARITRLRYWCFYSDLDQNKNKFWHTNFALLLYVFSLAIIGFAAFATVSYSVAVLFDYLSGKDNCADHNWPTIITCVGIGSMELIITILYLAMAAITIYPLIGWYAFLRPSEKNFIRSIIITAILSLPFVFSFPFIGVFIEYIFDTEPKKCNLSSFSGIYNLNCYMDGFSIIVILWIFYIGIGILYGLYKLFKCMCSTVNINVQNKSEYEMIA